MRYAFAGRDVRLSGILINDSAIARGESRENPRCRNEEISGCHVAAANGCFTKLDEERENTNKKIRRRPSVAIVIATASLINDFRRRLPSRFSLTTAQLSPATLFLAILKRNFAFQANRRKVEPRFHVTQLFHVSFNLLPTSTDSKSDCQDSTYRSVKRRFFDLAISTNFANSVYLNHAVLLFR